MSVIHVYLRTKAGMNTRELWPVRAKRVKTERQAVMWALNGRTPPSVPCSVLLTRVSPSSGLDDDNLVGALKSVRDQVAEWIGVDDRDRTRVRYRYAQRRGPWGVEISFGEPVSGDQVEIVEAA